MPSREAPCVELGAAPRTPSVGPSPSPSEVSGTSSPEPQSLRPTPLFRALAMPPPEPVQPAGQDELERRVPGYRRIVIPRELTLIELLKQSSGATTDEEVLQIREAKLRVIADRVGLRRLHVLAPCLRSLTLDGSAISSLRDLGIGLVHLKILSVNRCGLTCLDGVWGLGSLKELHAAGNRVYDLHPLAALQKMHTLNLADNPISDTSRLWTLAVCSALRCLTLRGTPASDVPDYRTRVAGSLPMLIYLDGRPLHTDIEEDMEGMFDEASSNSEPEDDEVTLPQPDPQPPPGDAQPGTSKEEIPGPSQMSDDSSEDIDISEESLRVPKVNRQRRRPATTENAGLRPLKPQLPPRPKTAQDRPNIDAPTRLQILNTLMDEEWRCSGSKLTSAGTVCGNLAQALLRPSSAKKRAQETKMYFEKVEEAVRDASRAISAEIPAVPHLEDWAEFKQKTGIDIDIDFNQRHEGNAETAIERLERIERETAERLKSGSTSKSYEYPSPQFACEVNFMNDLATWKLENITPSFNFRHDLATLFDDIGLVSSNEPSVHSSNAPSLLD